MRQFNDSTIYTTLVGSYPIPARLTARGLELFSEFQEWLCEKNGIVRPLESFFDYSAAHCVIDQIIIGRDPHGQGGIDVIGTGQPSISVYGDMSIPYFMFSPSFNLSPETPPVVRWTGERAPYSGVCNGLTNPVIREIEIADAIVEFVHTVKGWSVALKINVTGPATLAVHVHEAPAEAAGQPARRTLTEYFKDLILSAVHDIKGRHLLRHVHHLQIDEPVLTRAGFKHLQSQGFMSVLPSLIGELASMLDDTSAGGRISLHMCGEFDPRLLEFFRDARLYAIDLEFMHHFLDAPGRLGKGIAFLDGLGAIVAGGGPARIALGVVNSAKRTIETPQRLEAIVDLVETSFQKWQLPSRLLLKPDCGFGRLGLGEARSKLLALSELGQRYKDRISHAEAEACGRMTIGSWEGLDRATEGESRHITMLGRFAQMRSIIEEEFREMLAAVKRKLEFLHSRKLGEYTVHGDTHSRRVVHYTSQVLGGVQAHPDELKLLFLSAYSHDVGLFHASTNDRLFGRHVPEDRIVELVGLAYGNKGKERLLEIKKAYGSIAGIGDIDEFGELVREFHGLRSALFASPEELKKYFGTTSQWIDVYQQVVWSHQSWAVLPTEGLIGGMRVRLLAALVRMADEIDVGRGRLPPDETIQGILSRLAEFEVLAAGSADVSAKDRKKGESLQRSLAEFRKMDLVSHVYVDHQHRKIRVFHDADNEADNLRVEEIAAKITRNLECCREALEEGGIHIDKAVAERHVPSAPSLISRRMVVDERESRS